MTLDSPYVKAVERIADERGETPEDVIVDAVRLYVMAETVIARPREEPAQADPIPEVPSYHYDPNRPTEADVEAVRAVLRPIWTGVPYMAERSGLDAYVVRRACKALESRGEAVSTRENGAIQYMRAPKAVQQVLPEPEPEAKAPRRQRARGCQKAVLSSLGTSWMRTDDIVARVNERPGKEFTRENVLDTLRHLAREGTIERYPPVVEGRRPLDVEWRVPT